MTLIRATRHISLRSRGCPCPVPQGQKPWAGREAPAAAKHPLRGPEEGEARVGRPGGDQKTWGSALPSAACARFIPLRARPGAGLWKAIAGVGPFVPARPAPPRQRRRQGQRSVVSDSALGLHTPPCFSARLDCSFPLARTEGPWKLALPGVFWGLGLQSAELLPPTLFQSLRCSRGLFPAPTILGIWLEGPG